MNKQSDKIKWISANLLVNKIQYPAKRYGDYIVAKLSNYGNILIDKRSLKALVLTIDRPYVIAEDFKKWLDRGFIVITLLHKKLSDGSYYRAKYSYQNKHYILKAKDGSLVCVGDVSDFSVYKFLDGELEYFIVQNTQQKSAIFDKDGHKVSDWFDYIYSYGLFDNKSDYYIARKDNKEAIFHKSGQRVTDWFNNISHSGLVDGNSDYYLATKDGKDAIFDKDGKQVSGWYDYIEEEGLVKGQSNYYVATKEDKEAIFNKDGQRISYWFDWIDKNGFVDGHSDYYEVRKDGKYAIFYKDGQRVTEWYDRIYSSDLVKGKSDYYIAVKDGKEAIFHKSGVQVSDWFDEVDLYGLVKGQSDYYIAIKNGKRSIFDKNGKQITGWFDFVERDGLIDGKSNYFITFTIQEAKGNTITKGTMYIGKLGSSKLFGPFNGPVSWYNLGFVRDPTDTSIAVYTLDDKRLYISKVEVDQFFNQREDEYEQTK